MRWKWIRPSSIYTAENLCRYHRLLLPLDMVMYSCSGKGEIHITDLIRNCLSSESSGDSSSEGIWEERERDEGSSSNQFIISVLSGGRHSKCWEACRACCDHRSIQCKSTCQSRQLLLCPGTLLEILLGGGVLELFLLSWILQEFMLMCFPHVILKHLKCTMTDRWRLWQVGMFTKL